MDGVYIDLNQVMGPGASRWSVRAVAPEARTATGQWPTAETLAARIIEGLEQRAEEEPDEAKRGKLREAAALLGGTAKGVTTNVPTAVILRSAGIA